MGMNMALSVLMALVSATWAYADVVGPCAFIGSDIESCHIPEGTVSVGAGAFAGSSLKEIVIPEGVVSIGDYAFSGCRSLASVSLPSSLRVIGTGAFAGCESLEDVSVPDAVEMIGDSAFRGSGLMSFVPGPESKLRSIGAISFYGCDDLATVIFPSGLSHVGSGAFMGCGKLSTIILPGYLRELPDLLFAGDSLIAEISIPGSLLSVGDAAMDGCSGLRRIDAVTLDRVPEPGADVWHGVPAAGVNLYVSESAGQAFRADPQWGSFNVISGTTGVEDVMADSGSSCGLSVVASGSVFEIKASENIKLLRIYTVDGRLLLSASIGKAETSVSLPSGNAGVPLFVSALLENGQSVTTKVLLN